MLPELQDVKRLLEEAAVFLFLPGKLESNHDSEARWLGLGVMSNQLPLLALKFGHMFPETFFAAMLFFQLAQIGFGIGVRLVAFDAFA